MFRRLKFKVGQIWKKSTDPYRYKIVALTKNMVKAERSDIKQVVDFIHLDSDGTAEIDTSYWYQIIPVECLCGTNCKVCTYHKPEPYQLVE